MDNDLNRQLAELMEPEPKNKNSGANYLRSPLGWWSFDALRPGPIDWRPVPIDHNMMAVVRAEIERRGMHLKFMRALDRILGYATLPDLTRSVWIFINAPLELQIRAAIETLRNGK